MSATLWTIVLWLVAAMVACAAAATAFARLGWRGARPSLAALLGLAMAIALVPVAYGLEEGTWSRNTGAALTCGVVGLLGVAIVVASLRRAITAPRHGPGQCTACGYELRGLPRCPECGAEAN